MDDAGGKIFTDGALRDSRAWTGTPGACSTTEPVHFARYPGPASLLDGRLDSISLWNVAMSADQVLTNLTKVFQGAEPGLLGLWQGEEFAGTNVFDLSPAARHGARLGTNVTGARIRRSASCRRCCCKSR